MRLAAALIGVLAASGAARAEMFNGPVSVVLDLRGDATDGERGWLDGGFGKLRHGGDDGDWDAGAELARGAVVWRPRFGWTAEGYLHIEIDPEHDHAIDVGEAFLRWKPVPKGRTRYAVRAGAFYPPVSLEHDGTAWSTTRTITPSAINSWVGEEVKVAGVEATATRTFGAHEVGLTGAVFGYNDTAGTLLTFRGWALHDRQSTLLGDFPLPERNPAWWALRSRQNMNTQPFREVDGRLGVYGRVEWRMAAPVTLDLIHYDNAGDKTSVDDGQSSWETRFTNIGLKARVAEDTMLLAQAMTGDTVWVPLADADPVPYVDDLDFSAVYVLIDHTFGDQGIAARLDAFETRDNQAFNIVSTPEEGWSATAAWRRSFPRGLTLMAEAVYVDSDRPSRAEEGDDAEQQQLSLQTSLRLEF